MYLEQDGHETFIMFLSGVIDMDLVEFPTRVVNESMHTITIWFLFVYFKEISSFVS